MIKFFLIVSMSLLWITGLSQQIDFDSAFVSGGNKFRIQRFQLINSTTQLLVTNKGVVVLDDTLDFSVELRVIDFNRDSHADIIVNFMGNVDTQSLFMYSVSGGHFVKVKDFEKYPQAKPVKLSSDFYYSYRRAGCADNYWISDLFSITDFRVSLAGTIYGNGCETPGEIKIYAIENGKDRLVDKRSYNAIINVENDKWKFISDYWSKSYKLFLSQ